MNLPKLFKRALRLLGASLLLVAASTTSHANQDNTLVLALYDKDFVRAEKYLDDLTARFEKRTLAEFDYTAAYAELGFHRPELIRYLNAWVEQRPNSVQALLSRGRFYKRLADQKRGNKRFADVPKADIEEMRRLHGLAYTDLTAVLKLKPDAYYALVQLLNITQDHGAKAEARRMIDEANRIFPQNFVARARYLLQLTPRWGGSYPEMEQFIAESKSTGASPRQVRWLTAIMKDDQANWATRDDSEKKRKLYMEALQLFSDAPRDVARRYLMWAPGQICWQRAHKTARYCRGVY
jgi:hypothetical protein